MDQLSSLYVRMASGAHSQLHHPASVMAFVDQMQMRMEKSSAPRKSFLIDPSTPHSDVVIAESSALKPSVGWVTLQVTEGIRRGIHEWGIKIEHQGESNDESGLMLGIVPKNFSKYDTFISQGGGWCLSRAGKFYGHWRRTDNGGGALTFGTGDRVVLTLDYDAAVMTVRVGEKVVVGELSGLTMEVFPSVSLHYRHQHVRFDHHAIRETSTQHLPWLQRQAFPFAPVYMPLSFHEVQSLPLNSYLFSNLFQSYASLEGSSAVAMEDDGAALSSASPHVAVTASQKTCTATNSSDKEQRALRLYLSSEASAARLTTLSRAFAAVRRYVAVLPGTTSFLSQHVTAEYLRQRLYEAARDGVLHGGRDSGVASSSESLVFSLGGSGGAGYDAALNCGAVIVVHLFMRAVSSGQEVAAPLVFSFRDFLLSLPIFSLMECRSGNAGAGSALSPGTVQLAVDHIARLLDASCGAADAAVAAHVGAASRSRQSVTEGGGGAPGSAVTAALLEVAIVLALQRGLISEVLRVCRYLLRVPGGTLSPALVAWLRQHSATLIPRQPLPDIGLALKRACEDPANFTPTQIDPSTVVLSVAYGAGSASLYLHTADGLSKWGPSAATPYILLADTRQPSTYCVGASRSSMAVTHSHVVLLTDRMAADEVAFLLYSLQLDQQQLMRWTDVHSSWPRSLHANPQLATMTEDCVLVLFERSAPASVSRTVNGAAASTGTSASAVANSRRSGRSADLMAHTASSFSSSAASAPAAAGPPASAEWEVVAQGYNAATATALMGAPLWTRTLHHCPSTPSAISLDRCLLLRKPSLVDLGSPEEHLTVAGGHVTVELWVQLLDKEDAATLYQHGDRTTNGEVFLELIKWEGAFCIRGGYRHDVRGSCLVSAPLPPTAESRPLHLGLVFDGRWRLFFEGEEVAGNRQGPQVALDAPKQRWTVGAGCTCLLTGLRVWRLGRTAREISRDFRRSLVGDEPGLVVQLLFNERSGNVVLNYVRHVKASHAVCSGGFAHVPCDAAHPWRSHGAVSATSSPESAEAGAGRGARPLSAEAAPACARFHEWRDLTLTTCCVTRHTLLLSTPVGEDSPYASREGGGRVLTFFDLASGVAHRSLFFLTSRSPVRHLMRADPAGRLWEMFEVDAGLVKGEQEASYLLSLLGSTGATPQRPRDRILAVVPLPIEEEIEDGGGGGAARHRNLAVDQSGAFAGEARVGETATSSPPLRTTTSRAESGSRSSASLLGTTAAAAEAEQASSPLSAFSALLAQPNAAVPYSAVAVWLLKLLAAHADADPGAEGRLFTPLADDVSGRCVTEVRVILGEHLRVVKANNARRAVALKSALSWVVVAAALRVLLRLIRRARAFGLHPGPLGLTVVKEGAGKEEASFGRETAASSEHAGAATEVTMAFLLRELHTSSLRRRTGSSLLRARPSDRTDPLPTATVPNAPASAAILTTQPPQSLVSSSEGVDNADSLTLLGLLADVINEDGLTLSSVVVALACTVTIEGVGLFLPDVRQRAKLLRDLLPTSSPSTASPSKTTAKDGDTADDRVPALSVLLDAVAQSFTTVSAAAPLLAVEDGVASLSDVCDTLRTLLEESAVQWRRRWSRVPTADAATAAAAAGASTSSQGAARPSTTFNTFALSLSEAIASLQLLLLSACQGNRWEVSLAQMYASGAARSGGGGGGGGPGGRTVGVSSLSSDVSAIGSSGGGSGISAGAAGSGYGSGSAPTSIGGMMNARDVVSAAALDLQHLCFSQAASYHPCVRVYYSALFTSAETCLSLCTQRSASVNTADVTCQTPLSHVVASLAPTFLSAPLHTALSAIPFVLTVEDGEWFLTQLKQLLHLAETLLDALPEPTNGDDGHAEATQATAARRILLSLREALYYASVWVAAFLFNSSTVSSASVKEEAVRQRLGLASVTTTPTAQRTVTNLTATLDGPAEEGPAASPTRALSAGVRGTPAEEEAAAVWEHPLLEGGLWPQDAEVRAIATPTQNARKSPASSPLAGAKVRRDAFVAKLIQNSAYWSAKQATFDHLASKASASMAPLITRMAAAALHLSSLPIQSLPPVELEKLMCEVMRKLSRPVRTELMSRREEEDGGGDSSVPTPLSAPTPASRQHALDAALTELQHRSELLLRVRTCSELWEVEDALFALPTCEAGAVSSPATVQQKARAALHSYQLRQMRHRAHVASRPSYTLEEATQLVKRVILSRTTTSAALMAAQRQRERLALLRQTGIEHLLRLVQRAPQSAESVAMLLSARGRGSQSHYEDGVRGCGGGYMERIRKVFCQLLRFSLSPELTSPCTPVKDRSCCPSLSQASTASVLCGLLDRAWQPREFALLVELRAVPTLIERYVTLFTPLPSVQEAASASVGHVDGGGRGRGGSGSDAAGRHTSHGGDSKATSSRDRSNTAAAAVQGASHLYSVELRPVALAERRHRDHVISAQQARRSSKSALVSAAVLHGQSLVGEGAQRGSGGGGDGPLQYTTSEAMQAKVWMTVKNLVLQATAMLKTRRLSSMSRVEQTAVMSFLADALRAVGTELQHCRDVLARAVKDTPVLLAQAGDAAVLEPLVTVQDQVDLLCSLLSAVAGTLSNATAGVPAAQLSSLGTADEETSEAGEEQFLSATLSTVCAGIAETLMEVVFLDIHHARSVRNGAGVGCVVRDAAACARIASLLLCRCQTAAVGHFGTADATASASASMAASFASLPSSPLSPPTWRDMYASPVFSAIPLAAASIIDGGHTCLQRWLDLGTYAVATAGLSRTTQHVLLAFRRLLHQPAWAAELRCFAAAYKRLVLTYVKSVQGGRAEDDGDANASVRVRELSAVQLYVWSVILGGQLLAPPVDMGGQASYLDDNDGFQPTLAYVVDLETVIASSSPASGATTAPSASAGTSTSRHVRGSSHFPSKTAAAVAADGERVRNVVAVPTDPSGCHCRDEVSLSPGQLFLPSWEDPVVVPPYAELVADFLMPSIQHCVPLLAGQLDAAAAFTVMELSVFITFLHLTSGVMRARPDLARTLLETGMVRCIREQAQQSVVRLPYPLKVLKEWAAVLAVRAAEEVAEHIHAYDSMRVREGEAGATSGAAGAAGAGAADGHNSDVSERKKDGKIARGGRSSESSLAWTSRSASPMVAASPTQVRTPPPPFGSDGNDPAPAGGSSIRPSYTALSTSLAPFHGSGETLLETLRSGGLAASAPAFLPGAGVGIVGCSSTLGFTPAGTQLTTPTALTRDIASDYGLLRLARSFGVFAGAYGGSSIGAALVAARSSSPALTGNATATGSSTLTSARIPSRMESGAGGGAPMFLSFPMWDAHPPDGDATPAPLAAVRITPSSAEGHFPVWDDGFAIETAVILNDGDVYPAMGDSLSVPCSWARASASDYEEDSLPPASPSPFEFPLVTVLAADWTATSTTAEKMFPFIQIKVHRTCLSVTVTFPGSGAETVCVTKAMRREDWHRCMHVSVMCNASCVTLCRNGEAANVELRGDVGRRLETLLRQDGFLRAVVLGRDASGCGNGNGDGDTEDAVAAREVNGPTALLGGLRIWGTSVLRTSVRVVAELVARDHALQSFGLPEHLCFFEMKEGSGGCIHSADAAQQYRGVLSGGVRWAIEPLPLGFYPSIELNAGRPRSGVATAPVSSTRLPRSAMCALVDALSPFYFWRFGGDVMWSLLAMALRHATITALEVGMGPTYALQSLAVDNPPRSRLTRPLSSPSCVFDPRLVLGADQKMAHQLFRLFQLQDTGSLPNTHAQLIHDVVQRLVVVLAAEEEEKGKRQEDEGNAPPATKTAGTAVPPGDSLSPLAAFVRDTALLLRQLRRDDGEMFVMELPPLPPVSLPASAATTSAVPGAAVLPLALTNGGTGVLTFDTKYRNMEQATLYKDMELKNILAKYPDGQGGWPAFTLMAAEAPWAYLRSVPSSAGTRLTIDGKPQTVPSSSILTITVKSMMPVIVHATVRALCEALRALSRSAKRMPRRVRNENGNGCVDNEMSAAHRAASCLLDARVVASLIQQSSARSSDDDCVHFVLILTELLQLWRTMPRVSCHDQLPLAMAMSHLNLPLCSIVQHLNSDADIGSLVSVVTGTYSPYVQALVGLWISAIHVDCAWAGRSYVDTLRARWQRLLRTWRRAAVYRHTTASAVVSLTPRKAQRMLAEACTGRQGTRASSPTAPGSLCGAQQQQQQQLQPSTPPRPSMPLASTPPFLSPRANVLSSDTAALRAPLRTVLEEETPLLGSSHGRDDDESACMRATGAAPAIVLVAFEPAASSSLPPPSPSASQQLDEKPYEEDSDGLRCDVRSSTPKGVSRKGNGLWVVKGGGSCATAVRSNVGFTTGAVYWEVYVTNISRSEHPAASPNGATLASNVLVGVATERCLPTYAASGPDGAGVFVGSDSESWAFDGGRALRYYKGYSLESSPRTKWKMDDVIGFVLDITRNRLCCLHNGRLVSEFNGSFLSPQQRAGQVAVFPVIVCSGEGGCEVNFGATGFASTPPPGCLPVDPSLYVSEEAVRVWQLVMAEDVVARSRRAAPSSVGGGGNSPSNSTSSDVMVVDEEVESRGGVAGRRPRLTHPALPYLCRHLAAYTSGRFGPLDVGLLCADGNAKVVTSRECKSEKEPSLLFGSVAVTSGRWYYEVVLPGEPAFHVGWYAWTALDEHNGGVGAVSAGSATGRPQLGHDAASWSLDAARMTARHNRHQVSLTRRAWKCGDVVGCLLDCDAGIMCFTVNGEALVETHGAAATAAAASSGGNVPSPTASPPPQQQPSAQANSDTRHSDNDPANAPTGQSGPSSSTAASSAALFTGVSLSECRGLVPVILLEPKASLVCLWNEDELLFPPADGNYRALGGTCAVRSALVEVVTQPRQHRKGSNASHTATAANSRGEAGGVSSGGLDASALQKLLFYASKVQELHPTSLRSYTMPSLYGSTQSSSHDGGSPVAFRRSRTDGAGPANPPDQANGGENDGPTPSSPPAPAHTHAGQQQLRDLCGASGLDPSQLPAHLTALLFFAHLSAFIYPFGHVASLPFTVEDTPLGSSWAHTKLHHTLTTCRALAPPWAALRVLQWTLDATNGAGDGVRLSVNRRKALTVVRDPTASLLRRLRDSLFGQVFQLLSAKAPSLFTTNKKMWAVAFYGEGADDVGGPYRECLTQMCTELMSASLTLFLPSANVTSELGEVRDGFVLNPVCAPPVEVLMYRFIGRLMGGCLRGGEPLSLYLPSALWKYLVGEAADDTDLARVDVATLNALAYVERVAGVREGDVESSGAATAGAVDADTEHRNAELAELCPGGFSLLNDANVVDELVPGGARIPVTIHNAGLYVRLVRAHKLYGSGAAQRRALQQGFHEVVPLSSVAGLKWYELEELVCGQCDYDPDALLDAARFEGLSADDVRVGFLREVLRGFTRHQRALFMRFVSGRERMPPGIHLKIMPDDAARPHAMPPLTPRAPPTPASTTSSSVQVVRGRGAESTTTTTASVITPQPPPPTTEGSGGSESAGNGGGGGPRSGSFVRHGALQQSRLSNSISSNSHYQPHTASTSLTHPPSPPQLGFTPPPSQSMPLSPRLNRSIPPPVLQPRQLQAGQRGSTTRHAVAAEYPQQQQHIQGQDVDAALCDDSRLPHASTCFYWLRLPRYSSAAVMAAKLLFAIEQCVDIDADFRVHDTDVAQQEAGPSLARVSSDEDDLFEDFSHLR